MNQDRVTLVAVDVVNGCEGCHFLKNGVCSLEFNNKYPCDAIVRDDGRDVIWVEKIQ